MEDEIYEQGKKLLEEPIDTSKDFEAHKKAKTHYKACMDDDKQNELGDVQISKIKIFQTKKFSDSISQRARKFKKV